jgi:hypothetical protein
MGLLCIFIGFPTGSRWFIDCTLPPLRQSENASGVALLSPAQLTDAIASGNLPDVSLWWSYWGKLHPFTADPTYANTLSTYTAPAPGRVRFGTLALYTCPRGMVLDGYSTRFALSACHGRLGWYRPLDLNCTNRKGAQAYTLRYYANNLI